MILQKCYGPGAIAAGAALLMAISMVIAESLVARTLATYVLRPFDITGGPLVPALAVAVIAFAFLVNIAGNRSVGLFSLVMATLKIADIALFGIAALWSSGFRFAAASQADQAYSATRSERGAEVDGDGRSRVVELHRAIWLAVHELMRPWVAIRTT